MLVYERMSTPVITIDPETSIHDAHMLMRRERIRRLPVIDRYEKLVGILSQSDLLEASPSDATSLSIWEINYLLCKIKVSSIMTQHVITVSVDTPLEDAARIMADNKIGGLPVINDNCLAGIITETDLFKVFLELLGAREPGIRISAIVPSAPEELALLTQAIFEIGGNILALGTFKDKDSNGNEVTIKVAGVDANTLESAVMPYVIHILDIREPAYANSLYHKEFP
jgi:acetoin utilization protein AcuB